MSVPVSLSGLSAREEIIDAVLRISQAIDTNDISLWEGAWAKDANPTASLRGNTHTGYDEITANVFARVAPMDTHHQVSNFRIDVQEGASTARLTAYALAQHYRAGEGMVPDAPSLLAGGFYHIEAVKTADGSWKIKSWDVEIKWVSGSWEVMPH